MWNVDLRSMPRDTFIWAATHKGEVVRTRFVAKSKTVKEPFWQGVGPEACILAWQPFIRPAHPFTNAGEARAEIGAILAAEHLPIINDVGGM